jgi:hypothetical protein
VTSSIIDPIDVLGWLRVDIQPNETGCVIVGP